MVVSEKIAQVLKDMGISLPQPPPQVVRVPAKPKPPKQSAPSAVGQTDQANQTDANKTVHLALVNPTEPVDYVEPKWAKFLFHVWDDMEDTPAVMIAGPRGTGKTLAAMVYAARKGVPLLICNCNQEMTPESLLGCPRIDLKGVGGDYLQMGPFALAAKLDAVVLLDEVNYFPPATQAVANPLLDTIQGGVFLPYTGERINWPNPKVLMTYNDGYSGTREMNQALCDRCEPLVADYLAPAEERALIVNRTGCATDLADRAVKTANAIRAAARGDNGSVMPLDFDLSPRALLSFARRVVQGVQTESEAWREAVIGRVGGGARKQGARETVRQLSMQIGGFQL